MDAFLALADPNRRRMVELLSLGNRSAGDLAAQFDISPPAVSQHLKALREARLVHVEVRAQQRIYSLAPDGFSEVDRWLTQYARFWSTRLDKLQSILIEASRQPQPVEMPAAPKTKSGKTKKSKKRKKS